MARQKPPDPPPDDVPAWVMTFSDVITLLMTFFILLLTFATNQPESFDRLQVAMFGGGGATGFAGETDGIDRDALLVRERAQSGRMSSEGTEIPPIHSDPELETLGKGISGLEADEQRVLSHIHRIVYQLSTLIDAQGNVTKLGAQRLHLLAIQASRRPLQIDLAVHDEASLASALALAEYLTEVEKMPQFKVGVSIASRHVKRKHLTLVVSEDGAKRGT